MAVCLAGAGSVVVGKDVAEGIAETSSRSRRESSGTAQALGVRAASTGGACRLVVQRSIRMPHFVYPGADGGLRVCGPWPLALRSRIEVEANDGGEQGVLDGRPSARVSRPRTNQLRSFQKKKRESNLFNSLWRIR
jgi:hypothetical protein